jgi:uncharacterized protein
MVSYSGSAKKEARSPYTLSRRRRMRDIIILPGIGGSGETHWQTHWERSHPNMRRFTPASWDKPVLSDWIASLKRAIDGCREPPLLVAHSLACLLVPHYCIESAGRIAGAFLVAVPDPGGAHFPQGAMEFADVPEARFYFPSLILASSNDPYGTLDYARRRAAQWGAGLVEVGELGHINSSSNLGEWPEGRNLLLAFSTGCSSR